jgi:hypothetical protein
MSSDNPYGGQPGPYGQSGLEGPPPGPYGYAQPSTSAGDASYAFGPFAPQPDTGPGPVGQPPEPVPPGPTPQPGGPRRGRTLIILGVIALALMLVAVSTAVLLWRNQPTDPQPTPSRAPSGTASAPSSSAPSAALASDAVAGYLKALAAGNAAAALAYSADPVKPGPFMTNNVLAQSIKRAPITSIVVPEVTDQQATSVHATYRLGTTNVSTSYAVVQAAGRWKLATVSKAIDLGLVRSPSIPMLINGVKVTSNRVELLPGSYAFTSASPQLSYGSRNVVVITDPNAFANVFSLRPTLTDHGRKTAVRLANKSYDACLRARVPRPRNCPFAWTNSVYRFRSGSATWRQLGADPFKKSKVQLSGGSAQVGIKLRVRISGPCTFGGTSGTCTGRVTGDGVALLRFDRKKPSVIWLR